MSEEAQKITDIIARRLHVAHDLESDAMEMAKAIGDPGYTTLGLMFKSLELTMELGRKASSELGLNSAGGKAAPE